MYYYSTRGNKLRKTAAEAIAGGLSDGGGLFVPEAIPVLSEDDVASLASKSYADRAAYIMGAFLDGFSVEELFAYAGEAYSAPGFDDSGAAPLHKIDDNTHMLELWHGPTCAFKDIALQMLPRLLTASLRKTNEKRDVCILVATSGDTGKAALEGFRDVPGTRIIVFYPRDGVSDVQKLQMSTQAGKNVGVVAVEGNFDDTQTGVKSIFSDVGFRNELDGRGYFLSSANSINWGRLVPQIVYYFSSYCDLLAGGEIRPGDKINFCVPTGNFGNIMAAFYARSMGLPVGRLICASNSNDVLTQFLRTGVYDKNRPFYTTVSPSMDILISSNLERLLFELSDKDDGSVTGYMKSLSDMGRYKVSKSMRARVGSVFSGGWCSEEDTLKTIAVTFEKHKYLIDTHTAVALKVLGDYRSESVDERPTVVVSTASPFKFCESVLEALGNRSSGEGALLIDTLAEVTGCQAPAPLAGLKQRKPRFHEVVTPGDMLKKTREFLI